MPDHTPDRAADAPLAAAAYAALAELERVNELTASAPDLSERMAIADAAARRYAVYRAALAKLGGEAPNETMARVTGAIDDARLRTRTAEWWEGVAAASLSTSLSDELFAAVTREDGDKTDAAGPSWADRRLDGAVRSDPVLAARLSLWSRRLVGEAIVLAREFGGDLYPEIAAQLASEHARRMAALGLSE
ncbi:MAG TPA: ferritin-like fold-containing protein [Actinocrinis sp.]|uniref:ferritin-like fold-containing protein n=1 Tax=Actinocrinis sp. TaxID=1920516 RepID=UPI002DDCDC42|nr:ferritin-like fold-containing protein [Actinocrinis sp.]HEV3173497.1 ferritin-like fold-containing protein [Actinocrinis sp.]